MILKLGQPKRTCEIPIECTFQFTSRYEINNILNQKFDNQLVQIRQQLSELQLLDIITHRLIFGK